MLCFSPGMMLVNLGVETELPQVMGSVSLPGFWLQWEIHLSQFSLWC